VIRNPWRIDQESEAMSQTNRSKVLHQEEKYKGTNNFLLGVPVGFNSTPLSEILAIYATG